jgi:hypothetical protein
LPAVTVAMRAKMGISDITLRQSQKQREMNLLEKAFSFW